MHVGAGEPVVAKVSGTGMGSRIEVADKALTFDGARFRCK
jgi:hypothetical protein